MIADKITINNEDYGLIRCYKDINSYRQSLNKLTWMTYGFDFEDWYQQGFWRDKYLPYSLLHNGEIVANVSVSTIDFLIEGKLYHTVQIGTVMTEQDYRNKGLSRFLINTVLEDYKDKCDLFYLYANDTVLDFYPKYGFTEALEYKHSGYFSESRNRRSSRKLNIKDPVDKEIIIRLVTNTIPAAGVSMVGNAELALFYLNSFMSGDIYYIEDLDLIAVAEYDEEGLFLMDIFSETKFDLEEVIHSFVNKASMKVTLGFTPMKDDIFTCEKLKEEGTTFFTLGKNPMDKGRFPILSHA